MTEYTSNRFVDGKVRQIIIDENGNIVNMHPSKDELKGLEEEKYKRKKTKQYTDKELLNYLRQFYEEYERVPGATDFLNNFEYPSFRTYQLRFGSWYNALKLVGMNLDTRVAQGNLETNEEKARYAEIKVINHFKRHPIDLAGENRKSPCDGICPNGKTYDVKSSKLYVGGYYKFNIHNKYREDIEIYYFLAFNSDYTNLEYAWRIPGEMVEKDDFYVSTNSQSYAEFTVENMKEYDITDKFRNIIES